MARNYDIAITAGHVVDPENGVDAVMNVGIGAGKVTYLGDDLISADRVIDATGKIVSPGFVDLHSHAQNIPGHRLQAFDGVTTTFELESGASPVTDTLNWAGAEGRPLNYGFSAGWLHTRMIVMDKPGEAVLTALPKLPLDSMGAFPESGRWLEPAEGEEVEQIITLLEKQIDNGAVGIGMLLGYAPSVSREELVAVAELGARRSAPLIVHTRVSPMAPGQSAIEGFEELIEVSRETGAHIHMCHFNSSGSSDHEEGRELILAAHAEGVRFTTETYPYGFSSTVIGAAFLDPEKLQAAGRAPEIITLLNKGGTAQSYQEIAAARAENPGQLCLIKYYDDPWDGEDLKKVLSLEGAVFAADAMPITPVQGTSADSLEWPLPEEFSAHPRSTACFTRALAWLHRDSGVLGLAEVIARSTTLPAQILRPASPAMAAKGHLGVGADADVVIFDLDALKPNTSVSPVRPSKGVDHVLIGGAEVIVDGELLPEALPGQAVLSTTS